MGRINIKSLGLITFSLLFGLFSCRQKEKDFDATGNFEADEIIVSAQVNGLITAMNIEEGDSLKQGNSVAFIDVEPQKIQQQQIDATIQTIDSKSADFSEQIKLTDKQLEVQLSQLKVLQNDREKIRRMVEAGAVTGKQLIDISKLASGLYIVSIRTNENVLAKSLIIER